MGVIQSNGKASSAYQDTSEDMLNSEGTYFGL